MSDPTSSSSTAVAAATILGPPRTAEGRIPASLAPVPPSVPKPTVSAPTWRHKFTNHSVGSLPTTNGTQDSLGGEVIHDEEDDHRSFASSNTDSDQEEQDTPKKSPGHSSREKPKADVENGGATALKLDTTGFTPAPLSVEAPVELGIASESDEDDSDTSQAATDEYPPSAGSEPCLAHVDLEVAEDVSAHPPLLNLEEGLPPPEARARCPPTSWLIAAGFEMPSSGEAFESAPVAPVCGERPTRYLNLFCRQMLARHRTSELTVGALARHDTAQGRVRHTSAAAAAQGSKPAKQQEPAGEGVVTPEMLQNAEWLEAFVARARAAPLCQAAAVLLGGDVGHAVAGFLDGLSDTSDVAASLDGEDVPDGRHVTGHRVLVRHPLHGRGRAGFVVESDAAISTPGRSQSPPARRGPPPLPAEPLMPPLILSADQEQRQQFQRRVRGEQRQIWRIGA